MKVLVVDDSRIIRKILKNILSDRKIGPESVLEAQDGADALEILKSQKIDILFVDWNMPRVNGVELVKELRSMEGYTNTPIIMVTSEAARYNVIEAVKAGVSEYVVKPVSARTVLEKVDKYIKGGI